MQITLFVIHHLLDIFTLLALFFAATLQWIPPHMAGLERQFTDASTGELKTSRKQSLLEALMTSIFFTLNKSLLVVLGSRTAIPLLAFAAVGVELFYHHTLSTSAVMVAIVGIIALHFERLIEQADEISILRVFSWKRRKNT